MHADADAWLQNAISFRHNASDRINDGTVERMHHGADHRICGSARQLRIGIERDDVLHALQHIQVSSLDWKRIECPYQQFVEIEQFSTLTFPSHPYALACIEDPKAMQQKKCAILWRGIANIEVIDQLNSQVDERVRIFLTRTRDGIRQIGEQSKMQIRVWIRKEAYLQFFHQLTRLLFID